MKETMIKLALVGCGRISEKHIKALSKHQNRSEIVAICDQRVERLSFAKKQIESFFDLDSVSRKAKHFFDYDELITEIKEKRLLVDLIILATPSGLHPQQVISAAEIGCHICTEKPMATKWEDGKNMVRVCDENNVQLFVIKQNRFNKTMQLLKKQILEERFGRIALVTVNVFWQRPQEYYDMDDWRGTWDMDGGALMNQASHYVDLLHWLIGPVSSVSASIGTLGRKIEVEDTAAMQIKWESGTLGTMAVTMIAYPKNIEGSITVLGEKGTVSIGGTAVNKIKYWSFSDTTKDDKKAHDSSYEIKEVYGFGHEPYFKNVFDVLSNKDEPICDGKEGLKSLELLVAAYDSAKKNKIINLPLI